MVLHVFRTFYKNEFKGIIMVFIFLAYFTLYNGQTVIDKCASKISKGLVYQLVKWLMCIRLDRK